MGSTIDGDFERQALLIALLECDQSQSADPLRGVRGSLFFFIQMADTQWISHPRLPDGALFVQDRTDMQWLEDRNYIAIQERDRKGQSFTFELTENAQNVKRSAPRDVI